MDETIVIFVHGGVVQHIGGIPPGVTVLVRDYDVDPDDDPNYPRGRNGDPYFEGAWTGEKQVAADEKNSSPNRCLSRDALHD